LNLRKQLKDAQAENIRKTNELSILKKNFKYTKINELEIEVQSHIEENARLKNMLQQALKITDASSKYNLF
jgi:hypothetical protein